MTTYILPGMGADASMYGKAFRSLKGVKYINWPTYNNEQTITEISKRIINENSIQPHDIVGGSSLGGIVAAEISKHIKLSKLLLIGSTLTPKNINPMLQRLSTLSKTTPVNLLQISAGKANSIVKNSLLNMFSHADASFIKSMCKAVFEWDGNKNPCCPVKHIHGAKDTVIFPPIAGAKIIEQGGHLLAMTHETAVVEFINANVIKSPAT